jgi:hypothetical protein
MLNYLEIQHSVDEKLRKNGILFLITTEGVGTYDPVKGISSRETVIIGVYGLRVSVLRKPFPDGIELHYGDFMLMLSPLDSTGKQYELPKKGSSITINGCEAEVIGIATELNLTNVPLFYRIVLRNI